MTLTLYVDLMSQPCRAVALFCRLNNIPHQLKQVLIAKGQNRTPEFRAIHPLGKLPVMDDNGFVLSESHAILAYLATTRQVTGNWYPSDPRGRAMVDEMLHWHHSWLRRGAAGLVFNKLFAPRMGVKVLPGIIEDSAATLDRSLKYLESVLARQPYVAGAQISIADLSLACELIGVQLVAYDLSAFPNVVRWMTAMESLPHWGEVTAVHNKVLSRSQSSRRVSANNTSGQLTPNTVSGKVDYNSLADAVFQEISRRLPEEGPEYCKKIKSIFRFEIATHDTAGKPLTRVITVDLKNSPGSLVEGESKVRPTTTFQMKDKDFLDLGAGKMNPMVAFTSGKLKLKGNIMKAMEFNNVVLQKRGAEIREVLDQLQSKL